ncbi:MAG: dimethylarginine dimethylaminohydrolase family protein, partial [Acidimicrobiales bacterium]
SGRGPGLRGPAGPAGGLPWGRRFLQCKPEHFGVLYEINPWMSTAVEADPDRAMSQFERLRSTLIEAGASVELMPAAQGLPDLVFTANAGVVNGDQFVPARFRHAQRQGETPHDTEWFGAAGFRVDPLPGGLVHEGAGDALPFFPAGGGAVLLSGYRTRTDAASHAPLSALLGAPVRSVELVDERLYHLDLVFCPLDERRAIVAPIGLDRYGLAVIESLVPEILPLEDDEALAFAANSVVVGATVVMPTCPPRVGKLLEGWGFDVAVCAVPEFQKAGGGCRCLTLALDVELARG